jgi:hypothetical protein
MSRAKSANLRFALENKPKALIPDRAARLAGELSDLWTPMQAQAVMGVLRGWAQEHICASWTGTISPHTIDTHLKRAGWPEIQHQLVCFENDLNFRTHAKVVL